MTRGPVHLAAILGLVGVLSWGCSVNAESYDVASEAGTTHAVVAIDRQESTTGTLQAGAFAGFVHLPADADRDIALRLAGLELDLPPVGSCSTWESRRAAEELSALSRIEFLDAGDVTLHTQDGVHELAPHAFPTVTDLISGVVYASRDRSADNLPPSGAYQIVAGGAGATTGLDFAAYPPEMLTDVTANGAPLEAIEALVPGAALDLTWTPSPASSNNGSTLIYAELVATGTRSYRVACTFEDEMGAGTLMTDGFRANEGGFLSMHRLRRSFASGATLHGESSRGGHDPARALARSELDELELRFNFSVSSPVEFE